MSAAQKFGTEILSNDKGAELSGGHQLKVEVRTSWEELEAFSQRWDSMIESNPAATIFSTREWLRSWWTAYCSTNKLIAVLFFNSADQVVGVVPLYRDFLKGPLGLQLKRLRFVGDGTEDSDNLDFVLQPGYEKLCGEAFLSWLCQKSDWDICELNTLPSGSEIGACLLLSLRERGWTYAIYDRTRSRIELPDNWEAYLSQISKKEEKKIQYYMRRVQSRYQARFRKCVREEEISECLESLFRLHGMRWQVRGEPGIFSSPDRHIFYYEIARLFLVRQWLDFWLLELDGTPVAAQFGFRYGKTFFALQEGLDPSYSSDSVGYVLRAQVIRQLILDGIRCYDFLGGQTSSKERWGAKQGCYKDFHFGAPFSRGSLYLRLLSNFETIREWLRAHLPPAAFEYLRRAYRRVFDKRTGTKEIAN